MKHPRIRPPRALPKERDATAVMPHRRYTFTHSHTDAHITLSILKVGENGHIPLPPRHCVRYQYHDRTFRRVVSKYCVQTKSRRCELKIGSIRRCVGVGVRVGFGHNKRKGGKKESACTNSCVHTGALKHILESKYSTFQIHYRVSVLGLFKILWGFGVLLAGVSKRAYGQSVVIMFVWGDEKRCCWGCSCDILRSLESRLYTPTILAFFTKTQKHRHDVAPERKQRQHQSTNRLTTPKAFTGKE